MVEGLQEARRWHWDGGDVTLRWKPTSRDKEVLKEVRIYSWKRAEVFSWWVYERIVKLFAERAVALSGRLDGAGLILRRAVNKWTRQRRSHREQTAGDGKTKRMGAGAEAACVKQ